MDNGLHELQIEGRAYPMLGKVHEPGIYFGMPEEEYHADGSFSNSGIKDIDVSPLTYWTNHIDPDREDETKEALTTGKAFHKRILEGQDEFDKYFAVKPENDGTHLEGGTELRARCADLEISKSGSIKELCGRILEKDPDAKLWPLVIEEFTEASDGKIIIKPETWRPIELSARFINYHPFCGKAFQGGQAEVSIFWIHEGVPMKCRLDYLKIKAAIDLKTFANQMRKPINDAVALAVANEKYHVQAFLYLKGVEAAKRFVKSGNVHGEIDPEWLEAFAAHPQHSFIGIFMQKGRIPDIRVREFTKSEGKGGTENAYYTDAINRIHAGINTLKQCIDFYGDNDGPWLAPEKHRAFKDDDFPIWMVA